MKSLNDTHRVLLAAAAQREDASVLPLPEAMAEARARKAIAALIGADYVEEREVAASGVAHRTDGDLRYGLFATASGLAAIGIGDATESPAAEDAVEPNGQPAAPPRQNKSALVIELLRREGGATLADLVAATGWLPHTTRAALTGLRKKGHVIDRVKVDGTTTFRIASAA